MPLRPSERTFVITLTDAAAGTVAVGLALWTWSLTAGFTFSSAFVALHWHWFLAVPLWGAALAPTRLHGTALNLKGVRRGVADDRIALAFRLCLARDPSDLERRTMGEYLVREMARFESEPARAGEVASGGDIRPSPGMSAARFAAWTMAANVLLNLDEFVSWP